MSEIRVEDRGSRVEGRGFEYWRVEDLKVGGMRVEGLSRGESQQCARREETSGRKNPRKKSGFVWAKQALWWKGAHLNFLCDFVYFVCFVVHFPSKSFLRAFAVKILPIAPSSAIENDEKSVLTPF